MKTHRMTMDLQDFTWHFVRRTPTKVAWETLSDFSCSTRVLSENTTKTTQHQSRFGPKINACQRCGSKRHLIFFFGSKTLHLHEVSWNFPLSKHPVIEIIIGPWNKDPPWIPTMISCFMSRTGEMINVVRSEEFCQWSLRARTPHCWARGGEWRRRMSCPKKWVGKSNRKMGENQQVSKGFI